MLRLPPLTLRPLSRRISTFYREPPPHTEQLRALLRKTAQPVAVVTCKIPADGQQQTYHGATVSSFTSVALQPSPFVSFSMRTPSRLVSCIQEPGTPLSVNLLAAHQANIAEAFARPDLHPDPWANLNYTLDTEGMPVFAGALGTMHCVVEGTMLMGEEDGASMLFIARVDRVEHGSESALPLIYHNRGYTTIQMWPATAASLWHKS